LTRRARFLTGLLALTVILALGGYLFFRYQISKSFPETSGEIQLPSLQAPVSVSRDPFGVPVLVAASEHDLCVALGYVHAQDRLWQMDITRRAGEGRLSELFGEKTLPFDRLFRIVGIRRAAEEVEKTLTAGSRERIGWYAEGFNSFLNAHGGAYPVEFDFLNYEPEHWTVLHSLIVAQMMAWELNLSWWTDLTLGAITGRVDSARAADIQPGYPPGVRPIVGGSRSRPIAEMSKGLLDVSRAYLAFRGSGGPGGGSNAWVVSPGKSASGHVILANDTHLHLQLPSKWYEVFLRSPGFEVGGMSVPGTPGIVAGHNRDIVWGLTNMMADESDYYLIRVDSTDTTRYWYEGEQRSFQVREEEIPVSGGQPVTLQIRSTHHGPVVSDIVYPLRKSDLPFVAAMRWTGYEPADRIEAFNRIDHAKDWHEFLDAVRTYPGPGQNFVYGDAQGNIGYVAGGLIPIRGKVNSLLPLPGWLRSSEWKGFVPFDEMPRLFNPAEGYIATANNRITDERFPYYISDLWEPPSRIQRLREDLDQPVLFSVHDFEQMQNDPFSHYARELTPYLLQAWSDTVLGIPDEERIKGYLVNWDFRFSKDDIATTLFQQVLVRLLANIYEDEIGKALLHDFVMLGNIPIRVTQALVEQGSSPWFDDIRTPEQETMRSILCRSLTEATRALSDRLGPDTRTWQWGAVHTLTLRHPFGLVKPLDRIFNVGPFPLDGGPTCLMSAEYSFNEPFEVTVAGSFRTIFDFAAPEEVRSVLPSGQSGQVFHPHYSDQTSLWINGAYRTFHADSSSVQGPGWETLVLHP